MRTLRTTPHRNASLQHQAGLVLVTAMIMLFVMTMLMVTTMRTNVAEERMAGNARDWNTAFQAAESALRDAERDILNQVLNLPLNAKAPEPRIIGLTGFTDGCVGAGKQMGLCLPSPNGTPIWARLTSGNDAGWIYGQDAGSVTIKYGRFTGATKLDGVIEQPRYIIEGILVPSGSLVPSRNGFKYCYRVTAVGFGANISSRVMLQGVYRQF